MIIVEYDERSIGDVIRERRLDMRLTQKELARKSGVCLGSIACYERGELQPPIRVLCKLMSALQVDEIRIDTKRGWYW